MKKKKLVVLALCLLLLCVTALAGCGKELDFDEALEKIMSDAHGRPVLLYISKTS